MVRIRGLRVPKCRRCQSKWSVSRKNLSLSWTRLGLSWTELGFSRKWLGFGLNSQGVRELSIKIAPLGVVAPRSKMVDLSIKIAPIPGWVAPRSNEGPVNQTRKMLVKIGIMRRDRYQSKALDELIRTVVFSLFIYSLFS